MGKAVRVEPATVLLSIDYIEALAKAISSLRLSRRKVVELLAELIFGWLEDGGVILDADGVEIEIDDEMIDRVHGDDPDARSVSDIVKSAKTPRGRRPRRGMGARLMVYDVAFKLLGRPVTIEARRAEVARTRALIAGFSPVTRARYVRRLGDLRRGFKPDQRWAYVIAVSRLRRQLAAEAEHFRRQAD